MRRVRAKVCCRSLKTQLKVLSWPTALSLSRRTAIRSKNMAGVSERIMSALLRPAWAAGAPWRSSWAPVRYMLRQMALSAW
ncbi:hypothetical protein D3C81_2056920 [compost metagenome]